MDVGPDVDLNVDLDVDLDVDPDVGVPLAGQLECKIPGADFWDQTWVHKIRKN